MLRRRTFDLRPCNSRFVHVRVAASMTLHEAFAAKPVDDFCRSRISPARGLPQLLVLLAN